VCRVLCKKQGVDMGKALDSVVDSLDIETFIACSTEAEAREIAEAMIAEMNLPHGDIVFLEHQGWGARIRLRTYVHRPGDHYRWMSRKEVEK